MDNGNMNWRQRCRPGTRRLVQLYSALLYNAHLRGFIDGEIYVGRAKTVCVPGFNCYSCPGAIGACPLGSIQNALAAAGHQAGWYVLGIILLYGVILGRTICGWLCPLGLIQELLHKIPTPKIRKSRITRVLSWLKYILLAVFAAAIPLWYGLRHNMPLPGFCKYICPAGTFEGAIGLLANPVNSEKFSMLGILFTRKFIIMLLIGLLCVFCYRTFCRFICPLGAIYGLFNSFNVIGVKVDSSLCSGCGSCVFSCGMDVRHVGDHECINCGRCMEVCTRNAISIKAGSFTLKAPADKTDSLNRDQDINRKHVFRIIWSAALVFLCAALLWFNFLDPSVRKRSAAKPSVTPDEVMNEVSEREAENGISPAAENSSEKTTGASSNTAAEISAGTSAGTSAETSAGTSAETSAGTSAGTSAVTSAETSAGTSAEIPAEKAGVSFESSAPVGYEIGQQLADFTTPTFNGGEFHLADTRGKIVFINFWGTYCTPCVQELPDFEALLHEHEGDVAVIAVHSSMTGEVEPQDYVKSKGWDKWTLPFALDDEEEDTIFTIANGGSTLPQTIVLNRRGEVVYNRVGSVTPEMLEALYKQADAETPAAP